MLQSTLRHSHRRYRAVLLLLLLGGPTALSHSTKVSVGGVVSSSWPLVLSQQPRPGKEDQGKVPCRPVACQPPGAARGGAPPWRGAP